VPLDVDSVLGRQAEGVPELHVTGAAEDLLTEVLEAESTTLNEDGMTLAMARIGARALVTGIELYEGTVTGFRRDKSPDLAIFQQLSELFGWIVDLSLTESS
jgi:hypothetical protein